MSQLSASASGLSGIEREHEYEAYRDAVAARLTALGDTPLFETDAQDLFAVFLDALPDARQHYTCNACRRFIDDFGGLVTIAEDGSTTPVFWHEEDAPPFFRTAAARLAQRVRRARVRGVFYSAEETWGRPSTPDKQQGCVWTHFHARQPRERVFRDRLKTPFQAMAAKAENFRDLARALAEFSPEHLAVALQLLESDSLYRSEKTLGPAKFLAGLHRARAAPGLWKANVLWRAVATAPEGLCHPRASMIGTLLEDIAAGRSFEEVSRRFGDKMHPLRYQRPQAAPAAGNIKQAEEIVARLGVAASLRRRYARPDEIVALWRPRPAAPAAPSGGGVFDHLVPKGEKAPAPTLQAPAIRMTWDKFRRTVLADAEKIEFRPDATSTHFAALTTAVDPDAPPILQWDLAERRNPVAWYFWHKATATAWNLQPGRWYPASAVALGPPQWHDEAAFPHQGVGVFFALEGCHDALRRDMNTSLALFPESLKPELHAIRSVVEAHSKSRQLEGEAEGAVAGVYVRKGVDWSVVLRVTSRGATQEYLLDRWD